MVRKLGQSTLFVKVDFKGLTSVAFTDFFTSVMAFTTKLRFVASWLTSPAAFKAIKVIKSMLKSAPNRADNFSYFRWAELLKSWLSVVGRNRFTGYQGHKTRIVRCPSRAPRRTCNPDPSLIATAISSAVFWGMQIWTPNFLTISVRILSRNWRVRSISIRSCISPTADGDSGLRNSSVGWSSFRRQGSSWWSTGRNFSSEAWWCGVEFAYILSFKSPLHHELMSGRTFGNNESDCNGIRTVAFIS